MGDPDFHATFPAPNFDDSSWTTGADSEDPNAGFGYGETWFTGVDIGTPEPENRGTAYFRCRFTTDREHSGLSLRCYRDDGVVVYLDGQEVARDNMEPGSASHQLAASEAIGGPFETLPLAVPIPGTLPAGDHVLAISLHNHGRVSSDLRIGGITLVAEGEGEAVSGQ